MTKAATIAATRPLGESALIERTIVQRSSTILSDEATMYVQEGVKDRTWRCTFGMSRLEGLQGIWPTGNGAGGTGIKSVLGGK